jgi:hypothetical protein
VGDGSGRNQLRGFINLLSGLSNSRLMCDTCHKTTPLTNRYKNHRFPAEIISHAVWLYLRFCLSYRDVEEVLFAGGVIVTYEAIHQWCQKFGQPYANELRRRRSRPGATWRTWTRCFSPSMGHGIISGVPSIRTATCWIFSCKSVGTRRLRRNSFGSCSKAYATCQS